MKHGFYWKLALTNLKNHRQVYLPYLLSSTGICMMFYMLYSLGAGIELQGEDRMYGGSTVSLMMFYGVIVIGVFAVLFLFYTNSFIMKRRKKELGLYNILGMEKLHIARVIFRETLISAGVTILLGLGLGVLFSKLMFLALGKLLRVEIPIAFVIPPKGLLTTAILFFCIFLCTMLYNILQVRLSKPIELLHGSAVGEKEPRAHWLLALLGAASLAAGYYIAVSIQNPIDALLWFFIAVILVIAGTYLLFMTSITAILKLLKKSRRFYYKANHFTTVSGMLYRMKQNAVGLASICILFTCLLVTVSTTLSLYSGMEGILRTRYPRNVQVQINAPNEKTLEMVRSIIGEECEKAGVEPQNMRERAYVQQIAAARRGADLSLGSDAAAETYSVLEFIELSDFNRFSGLNETLNDGEILLIDPGNTFPESGTLTIDGKELKVKRIEYDMDEGVASLVYDTYYMVFPNLDAMVDVLNTRYQNTSAGDLRKVYTIGFDVNDDKELCIRLGNAIQARVGSDFPAEGTEFDYLSVENMGSSFESFFSLYGGLFFLGLFLGFLFLLGTALIIYYKQVSEGYEDARRFTIMQQVGMSRREVKKSIHSQILMVFFLPLLTAVLHLGFAFPMLRKIMIVLNMTDASRIFFSCLGCVGVFGLVYAAIYLITARIYYKIVETAAGE